MNGRSSLTRFAWLSIAAAIVTIALKAGAYAVTGSVGLLSDALESLVNLAAAVIALIALTIAAQPPDEDHTYGHEKAEYFSSGVEGALILIAAVSIAFTAIQRVLHPQPIEQPALGLTIAVIASLVNLGVAQILLRAGRRYESITLEADAHHLMTDVYTSAGVIAGVALVSLTGWYLLDPLIALAVAGHIVWSGVRLVRRSVAGLMDTALPAAEREVLDATLAPFRAKGIVFHALRTRQSGARRFVSFHVLVPGTWSVRRGHTLLERVERDVRQALPNTTVFTHLEPIEDPASFQDTTLDRNEDRQM
ncbi:cation diffusion facilitator family transporter [Roseiflexus sp.]|uniref:cation diffusion facilitator family transporter n=1 Tax=Roseiflexus sp. TaxID=2562120 RepID=UPI00398AC9F5